MSQRLPDSKKISTAERRKNVRGKFKATKLVKNKTVLLFDDVYTSGSTLAECAHVLLQNGAEKVIPFTLCLVSPSTKIPINNLKCKSCNSDMEIKFNTKKGNEFWGCSNYSKGEDHTTYDFKPGIELLRKLWLASGS